MERHGTLNSASRTRQDSCNISGGGGTTNATAPFAPLLAASPYVDETWIDPRPRAWQLGIPGCLTGSSCR